MRPAIEKGAWLLLMGGLLVVTLGMSAAAGQVSVLTPQCVALGGPAVAAATASIPGGQQVYHDRKTNAAFFFSTTADGAARIAVRAGELDVDKVVYVDGRFRLTLQAGNDVVSFSGLPGVIQVQRGKERGRSLEVGRASQDDWLQLKVHLAGSKALRLFRGFANNLDDATLQTPAGTAMLLSDALLALLDGDPRAVRRLGERWRPATQATIRSAALRQTPVFLLCWVNYEKAIYQAYLEYVQCLTDDWLLQLVLHACDWEYLLKGESIWFQFVGCSMFPI